MVRIDRMINPNSAPLWVLNWRQIALFWLTGFGKAALASVITDPRV